MWESCLPHTRLGVKPMNCCLWRELQSRTHPTWPAMLLHMSVFLAQAPSFGGPFIWGFSLRPGLDASVKTFIREVTKNFGDTFLYCDLELNTVLHLALPLPSYPRPRVLKLQDPFLGAPFAVKQLLHLCRFTWSLTSVLVLGGMWSSGELTLSPIHRLSYSITVSDERLNYYFTLACLFFFFCHEACAILVPRPGIEPHPGQWKRRVLTTGPPGNSLAYCLNRLLWNLAACLSPTHLSSWHI